jgi:hypothetical protein
MSVMFLVYLLPENYSLFILTSILAQMHVIGERCHWAVAYKAVHDV